MQKKAGARRREQKHEKHFVPSTLTKLLYATAPAFVAHDAGPPVAVCVQKTSALV